MTIDISIAIRDGMPECAASWTEELMVGSSIPAVAQGYLIFPAQKDERHQEQLHSLVARKNGLLVKWRG